MRARGRGLRRAAPDRRGDRLLPRPPELEIPASLVRGEVWWARTPSGDRPVLVLTRDPLADRLDAVVVAACTTRIRGLRTELPLGEEDGMPEECVASFDNLHTIDRPL